ncbi:MAG: hypothetical protein HOD64_06640 [Candidatus Cloacimonetes bacterium]|jgi:hypothetical protein|nr:hypothetical protein [Candidatus Cloacimonadota bacterium]MBT4332937.1 hypothetical protein [Candidatus Cloacimonadota bacterium]
MKILKNNKGYSLIEILAGLPLVTLVFVIFGIGIIHFTTTFQEVKLYTQLQQDLFDAIEIMRHGYMYENVTDDEGLIGLSTAKKVVIGSSSIKVTPLVLNLDLESNYWVTYAINDNSQIEINGSYGLTPFPERRVIFPSSPTKYIGNQAQFRITNPNQIWSVVHTDFEGNATMVKIKLVGQVRFREKQPRQSNEDDIRKNVRTITYETAVYLGNSHAASE